MTIVRWGWPSILYVLLLQAWIVFLMPPGWPRWVAVALAVLWTGFVVAFFRNPARRAQGDERTLIAPADGVVSDIEVVEEPQVIGGRALRIGIFLSVFDVHVNRAPVAGRVVWADYRPGRFLDARHPDVSHANEVNALGIEVDPAVHPRLRILVRQLSGLIARRIICTHGVGETLARGELFGMIKFGSRTELWVPEGVGECRVQVGQRVRCGETALVVLAEPNADG